MDDILVNVRTSRCDEFEMYYSKSSDSLEVFSYNCKHGTVELVRTKPNLFKLQRSTYKVDIYVYMSSVNTRICNRWMQPIYQL